MSIEIVVADPTVLWYIFNYNRKGGGILADRYNIYGFKGKFPVIPESCTIYENVTICGDVHLGENCVILPGSVLRADHNPIHVELGEKGAVEIGSGVTVGHGAVIHGCRIGNRCIIGMGAVIQDEAVIEDECLIGAGSVVTPASVIPKGHLAVGVPAKVKRPLNEREIAEIGISVNEYQEYAAEYRKNNIK